MQTLEQFFDLDQTFDVIRTNQKTWSNVSLFQAITQRKEEVLELANETGFVLVISDDPIELYTTVFALWIMGIRVVFPTRAIVDGSEGSDIASKLIRFSKGVLTITANPDYKVYSNLPRDGCSIVYSSGSTGVPKGILHRNSHFIENANQTAISLGFKGVESVTFLKPYLVSALSHFLVHLRTRSCLTFLDLDEMENLTKIYEANPSIGFVGSPMHLLLAKEYIPENASPAHFMTSGDFVYPETIREVIKNYPNSVFYYVYGLAELAGRFFINKIDALSKRNDMESVGRALGGIKYSVQSDQLYVESSFLYLGYLRDGVFVPSGGKHPTGDSVIEKGDKLFLTGRVDDEVKIGGQKVALKHLEQKISKVLTDDVVVVVPKSHKRLGTMIALVVKSNANYSKQQIVSMLQGRIPQGEIPQYYYKIHDIPYTQTMKIDRRNVQSALDELELIR